MEECSTIEAAGKVMRRKQGGEREKLVVGYVFGALGHPGLLFSLASFEI